MNWPRFVAVTVAVLVVLVLFVLAEAGGDAAARGVEWSSVAGTSHDASADAVTANAALAKPSLWVTPLLLDFGPVPVNSTSAAQVVTITNTGAATLTNFAGGAPLDTQFFATQNCAGGVAPGASCRYTFTFRPESTGVFTTTSNSSTNAGEFTIILRGEGRVGGPPPGPGLSVSPLVLDFGPVAIGTPSAPQTVTIRNTGSATLTDFAGGAPFDTRFFATQNCAGGVAPGGSCQYTFRYTPTALGRYTTTSQTFTNAGSFVITLVGGVAAPNLAQGFEPATILPGATATLRLTVTNPNQAATLTGVTVNNPFPDGLTVASPAAFGASSECGTPTFAPVAGATSITFSEGTILGRATCVITVSVTASSPGSYLNVTAVGSANGGTGNATAATLVVAEPTATPTTTPTTMPGSPTPTATASTTPSSTATPVPGLDVVGYLPVVLEGVP